MSFVPHSVMETAAIAGNLHSGADANTNRTRTLEVDEYACLCCDTKSDHRNCLFYINAYCMVINSL